MLDPLAFAAGDVLLAADAAGAAAAGLLAAGGRGGGGGGGGGGGAIGVDTDPNGKFWRWGAAAAGALGGVIGAGGCGGVSAAGVDVVSAGAAACGMTAPHFRQSLEDVADSKPQELHVFIIL